MPVLETDHLSSYFYPQDIIKLYNNVIMKQKGKNNERFQSVNIIGSRKFRCR